MCLWAEELHELFITNGHDVVCISTIISYGYGEVISE